MLDHILRLISEASLTRRQVVELVVDVLRGIGIDAQIGEIFGGSDGYHLVIHLRKVREL